MILGRFKVVVLGLVWDLNLVGDEGSCRVEILWVPLHPHDQHPPHDLVLPSLLARVQTMSAKSPLVALDYSSKLVDVSFPPVLNRSVGRDKRLVEQVVRTGNLVPINWTRIKKQFEFYLGQCLHKANGVNVVFIDVRRRERDADMIEVDPLDVDKRMDEQDADGVVVHNEFMVIVATFTPSVCQRMYSEAESALGFTSTISQSAIRGIQKIGNSDHTQKKSSGVYFASFGLSTRVQPDFDNCKSLDRQARQRKLDGPSRSEIPNPQNDYSLSKSVGPIYFRDFVPYFFGKGREPYDQFYGPSDRQRNKNFRFPKDHGLESRKSIYMSPPVVASMPMSNDDPDIIAAAEMENRLRNISEWLLLNMFGPLPFSATGLICAQNLEEANKRYRARTNANLPWATLARVFPKGSVGTRLTRDLHDDGNGAISPGVWTCLTDHDDVVFNMLGHRLNIEISARSKRFVWFMGWVPHRVVSKSGKDCRSLGPMEKTERIHHSAFSKLDYEQACLVAFSRKNVEKTVREIPVSSSPSERGFGGRSLVSSPRRSPRLVGAEAQVPDAQVPDTPNSMYGAASALLQLGGAVEETSLAKGRGRRSCSGSVMDGRRPKRGAVQRPASQKCPPSKKKRSRFVRDETQPTRQLPMRAAKRRR